MKYVTEVTENYRVDTEPEAARLIEQSKNDNAYTLKKYTSVHKERFSKGELIEDYYKVTLVKVFNAEKDPINEITITYTNGYSAPIINLVETEEEDN